MQVESQDFYLAVFLCLNGLDIKELRPFGNRTMFVFEDNKKFQDLKQDYYWNNAQVDPLLFKQEIRNLKSLIYNNT